MTECLAAHLFNTRLSSSSGAPAWPGPGTLNLAAELPALSATIAFTGTITLPDAGGDFWAMLAAALPGNRRSRAVGSIG